MLNFMRTIEIISLTYGTLFGFPGRAIGDNMEALGRHRSNSTSFSDQGEVLYEA